MRPTYDHAGIALYVGDCRTVLAELPRKSVRTCVTSPPYFGLRDYGTAQWEGGDQGCSHTKSVASPLNAGFNERWGNAPGDKKQESQRHEVAYRDICGKCGAQRIDSQIGLEVSPTAYVAQLVTVFDAVRDVLRDDGTIWLNLGDSYASQGGSDRVPGTTGQISRETAAAQRIPRVEKQGCIKPKDLLGIPWRVAFALQEAGWYLRSDIVWAKPNPMPESVKDRPTRAHEYIFLLSKRATYYYDADAIAEAAVSDHDSGNGYDRPEQLSRAGRGQRQRWTLAASGGTRNRRDVWTVASDPYPEAHFATFPPKLIEPCILAGSAPGDVVLDPFAGSGTTLQVAKHLNRRAIGIELNPSYADLAVMRLQQDVLPLGEAAS